MGIAYNTSLVTDGLVFSIDAANPRSYSGSGITVNGLVSGIGGTLFNGVGFSSANNGSFFFDGTNDQISTANIDLSYTVAEPLPIFRQARRRNDSVGKTGTVWRILSQDEARVRSGPIEDPWVEAHS